MHMRDELGSIYEDESFADLFPNNGQPAEAPWRLALVTIIQFAEGLSDRQEAPAVRGRIDVKYALSLELTDPALMPRWAVEFRARLLAGHAEEQLLTAMLTLFKERGWRHPRVANSGRIRRMCAARDPSDQSAKGVLGPDVIFSLWNDHLATQCPRTPFVCFLHLCYTHRCWVIWWLGNRG